MGNVEKILFDGRVNPISDIYADMRTWERCEDFHLHWRNLRLIFNKEEFELFCKTTNAAYEKWKSLGCLDPEPGKSLPEYLFCSKVDPTHSRRPADLKIELQGNLPYMPENFIHIHYKSYRLDVSHREFIELAKAFALALKVFKKWKNES